MSYERFRPSFVFDEERMKKLYEIAPEAFADGKINWETLKEALGEYLEDEGTEAEHFGLVWPGKKEARKIASIPSNGTLIPAPGEGVNKETTKNIFIEGENLEVLKLLQKSYAGRIKMIYIDPPYNTGNDFVYDDNFTEPLEEYLKYTGQMDEEGRLLTTNKKADGRFHSKWLSMMYPRLRLARNLLREDGVIFISIDDNEVANLRKICDEIFGEENFIAQIIWKKKYGGGAKTIYYVDLHEYVLCYSKNISLIENIEIPYKEELISKYYKYRDSKYALRGPYRLQPLSTNSNDERPNLRYPIIYAGNEIWPEMQWQWSRERTESAQNNDELVINTNKGKTTVNFKQYLKDENGEMRTNKPFSIIEGIYTQHGTNEISELLGNGKVFPFPKPTNFIKEIAAPFLLTNDIMLDFFSGSATSAHALLDLNKQDNGNRKFILIQLPESCDEKSEAYKAGYKTIAEIAKERLRRVINGYGKDPRPINDGFKVFKLDRSHFKEWKNYVGSDFKKLEELFVDQETPLVANWKPEDLLMEVMLQEGFPLDSDIVAFKDCKKNLVTNVSSDFCQHRLFVTFDEKIAQDTVDSIAMEKGDIFVCLDTALTDEQKVTLSDKGFLKTI